LRLIVTGAGLHQEVLDTRKYGEYVG
jgi:hypothetical protein